MAENGFIPLKEFAMIERDQEKWRSSTREPTHYTNMHGGGFNYACYSKRLELGETDFVRKTLHEEVIVAAHPLKFVLRANMDMDAELALENYLDRLKLDPLQVATYVKAKVTSVPSIEYVDFQITADVAHLKDIEDVVDHCGNKMFGELNWPKLTPIFRGSTVDQYVNERSRDITAALRDKALEALDLAHPEELAVCVDHHEFSHHFRGEMIISAGFMGEHIPPIYKNEYEMCNYNVKVLDETLAIFSELRGPATDRTPNINYANRYSLYFRLAKLISYDQDAPVVTEEGIRPRPNSLAEYIWKVQSNSPIDNDVFDEHELGVLLLVLGPKALSESSDRLATISFDNANVDYIYERVAQIMADPDEFIRSLDGAYYDALYKGFTNRIQRINDIEDISTGIALPEEDTQP